MSSSQALYSRLFAYLRAVHPDPHVKRISNWVWVMVGMILSHSVHLSKIAEYIPSEAEAAGRIAQIRRWLSNRFVDPVEFYRPLITQVLQAWAGRQVFVLIDGLAVNNDKLQVIRVSLSHAYRALPLGWVVLKGKGPCFCQSKRGSPAKFVKWPSAEVQRAHVNVHRARASVADRTWHDHTSVA
jgi:hypothetical protein